MVNKKKRQKNIPNNGDHGTVVPLNSNGQMISLSQSNIQSVDSIEVKQEADIKPDPLSVGELVDVPISTYENATHAPDSNEGEADDDLDFQSLDEVKVEVKKECDDKKEEEEPNMNADSRSVDGAMSNQPDQPMHDESDFEFSQRNDNNKNEQKRGGDAHGNPSKRHKCNFCEYSTDHKGHFNQHLLKHTGNKPHGCNFCPKRFSSKQNLLNHMKVHVDEFLFHCPSCLEGFSDKDEKNAHETICKVRRYECHLCKESFGSLKADMMQHMRVHSGDKPFGCEECFKKFTEKGNLNRHIKLHDGSRLFRCSKCNTRFSQVGERNTHVAKCNRPVFKCDVCGKSFGLNKSHLISHMRTHSGERPFECKKCPKKFTAKRNLTLHMKIHTEELSSKCLICRKGFLKDTKRKAHQRNCNGRYYECYLCKKFFNTGIVWLKGHMHTHSGEKPFQCQLCRKTFTRKVNLNKHMKNIHQK